MGDEVRGRTKIEVYKKFRATVNRKRIEDRTGLFMDAGNGTKPELYRSMKKDEATGEWVLYYHFGKSRFTGNWAGSKTLPRRHMRPSITARKRKMISARLTPLLA
jgi:hypothetical protein